MLANLSKKIVVDLGSSKIRIVAVDRLESSVWELSALDFRSKMLEDDACIVRKKESGKTIAIGSEALSMRGRLDQSLELVFPFVRSRIIDQEAAQTLLKALLQKVFNGLIFSPEVLVTTVANATLVDQKLLSQLFYSLGFAKVHFIAEPLAAAIGAGIPIADSSGTLLLHMGASSLQFTSIALGSVLHCKQSDFAGRSLDEEIRDHLSLHENFNVSLENAAFIKEKVFSLQDNKKSLIVMGKTRSGSNPLELKIKNENLSAVTDLFKVECESLLRTLISDLPPELTQDVTNKGLLLSGGLARLNGLEDFLLKTFKLPAALLEDADLLAAMGSAEMLRNIKLFDSMPPLTLSA